MFPYFKPLNFKGQSKKVILLMKCRPKLNCYAQSLIDFFNKIRWFAGSVGQMTHRPSVWCSKYYYFFHNFLQNSLQKSFQFISFLIKKKSFEPPIRRNYENKYCLEHPTHGWWVVRPINPATQSIILNICQICGCWTSFKIITSLH